MYDTEKFNAVFCTNQVRRLASGEEIPCVFPAGVQDRKSDKGWRLLEVTARVGLPLFYGSLPEGDETPAHYILDANAGGVNTADNRVITVLSSNWNPKTSKIDHEAIFMMGRPSVMLIRADGQDLDVFQVTILLQFVTKTLARPSSSFNADATPEKFVEFWNAYPWPGEAQKCPVTLGCKSCGKDARLRCGKCGVVKYCDSVCQKSHWSAHKKVCAKAWGLGV